MIALALVALPLLAAPPARSQSLTDMVKKAQGKEDSTAVADTVAVDTLKVLPAPWPVVAGEIAAGSALAAGLAYGVGLAAQHLVCSSCSASEPGGDTPGILIGIPLGAAAGVWLVGRDDPPPGEVIDTALGAMAGAAVFAGYSQLLENRSDLIRWSGVLASATVTAIAWNQSRLVIPRSAALRWGGIPMGNRRGWEMPLFRVIF